MKKSDQTMLIVGLGVLGFLWWQTQQKQKAATQIAVQPQAPIQSLSPQQRIQQQGQTLLQRTEAQAVNALSPAISSAVNAGVQDVTSFLSNIFTTTPPVDTSSVVDAASTAADFVV